MIYQSCDDNHFSTKHETFSKSKIESIETKNIMKETKYNKILHQFWIGHLDLDISDLMNKCRKMHENMNWSYMLWNEKSIRNLYGENVSLLNQLFFDSYFHEKHRASDIVRYEILYAFGGVYLDADTECLRPLDTLLDNVFTTDKANYVECFASKESYETHPNFVGRFKEFKHGLIANGALGCRQNYSNVMKTFIDNIKYVDMKQDAWIATGPYYISTQYEQHNLSIRVLPHHIFYPIHFSDYNAEVLPDAALIQKLIKNGSYAHHHWKTTYKWK